MKPDIDVICPNCAKKASFFAHEVLSDRKSVHVPYAWQFREEDIATLIDKGFKINIFGLISRDNRSYWTCTKETINSTFVINYPHEVAIKIKQETVIVLDNASIHRSHAFEVARVYWEKRECYFFSSCLFSTLRYRRNMVERIKGKVVRIYRLPNKGNTQICDHTSPKSSREEAD